MFKIILIILISLFVLSCREGYIDEPQDKLPPDSGIPTPNAVFRTLKLVGGFKSKNGDTKRFNLLGFKNVSEINLFGSGNDSQNVWLDIDNINKGIKVQKVSPYNIIPIDLVICINTSNSSINSIIDTIYKQIYKFQDYFSAFGLDIRIGAVGFLGDIRGYFDLTDDLYYLKSWMYSSKFKDTVNQLLYPNFGAGEFMENAITSVKFADSLFSWRLGSIKSFIIITDKPIYPMGKSAYSLDWLLSRTAFFNINVYFVGDPSKYSNQWQQINYNVQNPKLMADYTGGFYQVINKNEIDLITSPFKEMLTQSHSIDFFSKSGTKIIKSVVKLGSQSDGQSTYRIVF